MAAKLPVKHTSDGVPIYQGVCQLPSCRKEYLYTGEDTGYCSDRCEEDQAVMTIRQEASKTGASSETVAALIEKYRATRKRK